MRIVIRLLSCVVIASSVITVWTRAALVFVLGPQLTAVCLWIAAGGSVCAVITLALTRKPRRLQPYRPPEPPQAPCAATAAGRGGGDQRPASPRAASEPGPPRGVPVPGSGDVGLGSRGLLASARSGGGRPGSRRLADGRPRVGLARPGPVGGSAGLAVTGTVPPGSPVTVRPCRFCSPVTAAPGGPLLRHRRPPGGGSLTGRQA